jgi:hypothetical protein
MKVFIDNKLIRTMSAPETSLEKASSLASFVHENGQRAQIVFGWPSFLEYMDLGFLFKTFSLFNDENPLFNFILSSLAAGADKDLLIYLYDQTFVECLTRVKAIPQIDQTFLLNQIEKKRYSSSFSNTQEFFSSSLDHYELLLKQDPYNTLHDLTLYLAWDRVCVNLAIVFERASSDPSSSHGLEVLKECVLESFQHITKQGKTAPGLFRLIETLYAYKMREEKLQLYSESEWAILCQSSAALRPREDMVDVFYIDAAVIDQELNDKEKDLLRVLTMESADIIHASLSLAHYTLDHLKLESAEWQYSIHPVEVICLKENENAFQIETIIRHDSL